jgi:hypothetical protein
MDCSSYEQCDLSFVPIRHPCVSLVSPKPLLHPSFSHLVHIVIPNTHTIYHQNKCPTQHVVKSLNYIGVSACTTNGYINILTLIHVLPIHWISNLVIICSLKFNFMGLGFQHNQGISYRFSLVKVVISHSHNTTLQNLRGITNLIWQIGTTRLSHMTPILIYHLMLFNILP